MLTAVATRHRSALRSRFPPPCTHKPQTLIIRKISNTIQRPPHSARLSPGTGGFCEDSGACFPRISLSFGHLSTTGEAELESHYLRQAVRRPHHPRGTPPPLSSPKLIFPPRRHKLNLFSQQKQRTPEAWGGKNWPSNQEKCLVITAVAVQVWRAL